MKSLGASLFLLPVSTCKFLGRLHLQLCSHLTAGKKWNVRPILFLAVVIGNDSSFCFLYRYNQELKAKGIQ